MKLHDRNLPGSQHGIVLFTVLIALVVLSLASVALVRSIDTGVTIAGNLAFRQAATQAADAGTEAALGWIQARLGDGGASELETTKTSGYYATARPGCDLTGGETAAAGDNVRWEAGDPANLDCGMVAVAVDSTLLPPGYSASYVINRMCNIDGPVNGVSAGGVAVLCDNYIRTTAAADDGGTKTSIGYQSRSPTSSQLYYRVTTRVVGPNNAVSHVQVVLVN
jgi:type IV pilus assembly protein PilX